MRVETVGEILKHAIKFEDLVADVYMAVSRASTREGVRLLTAYMSRHRRRLWRALGDLPSGYLANVARAILHYPVDVTEMRQLLDAGLSPDASAQEVLDAAIRFDEALVRFYTRAVEGTDDREGREVLESLLRAERRDEVELKKIKAMDYF
jgi:hypothetical protein